MSVPHRVDEATRSASTSSEIPSGPTVENAVITSASVALDSNAFRTTDRTLVSDLTGLGSTARVVACSMTVSQIEAELGRSDRVFFDKKVADVAKETGLNPTLATQPERATEVAEAIWSVLTCKTLCATPRRVLDASKGAYLPYITQQIKSGQPIKIVMLGLPFKHTTFIPGKNDFFSHDPDGAELTTFARMKSVSEAIGKYLYQPKEQNSSPLQFTILADGSVGLPHETILRGAAEGTPPTLLGFRADRIAHYQERCRELISRIGAPVHLQDLQSSIDLHHPNYEQCLAGIHQNYEALPMRERVHQMYRDRFQALANTQGSGESVEDINTHAARHAEAIIDRYRKRFRVLRPDLSEDAQAKGAEALAYQYEVHLHARKHLGHPPAVSEAMGMYFSLLDAGTDGCRPNWEPLDRSSSATAERGLLVVDDYRYYDSYRDGSVSTQDGRTICFHLDDRGLDDHCIERPKIVLNSSNPVRLNGTGLVISLEIVDDRTQQKKLTEQSARRVSEIIANDQQFEDWRDIQLEGTEDEAPLADRVMQAFQTFRNRCKVMGEAPRRRVVEPRAVQDLLDSESVVALCVTDLVGSDRVMAFASRWKLDSL